MPPRKACDTCFKRKIQCSIPSPGVPCNWCSNQKIPCTFTRKPQKKRQSLITSDTVSALSRRVEQLEADLARNAESQFPSPESGISNQPQTRHVVDNGASQSTQSPIDDASERTGPFLRLSQQLGRNWYHRGMQILSKQGQQWMESKTGQPLPLQNYVAFEVPRHICTLQATHGRSTRELPSKHTTHEMIDAFFNSSVSLPVLDRTLIYTTVEEAYCPSPSLPAQACVWAIHTWRKSLLTSTVDIETCAAECQFLLWKCNWESSLDALQAILLLQHHCTLLASQDNNLHAIACRMVCELRDPEASPSDRKRHIDVLFGLLYILDKDIAVRSGRPLLTEDYCDLTFLDTATEDSYPSDLELSFIKERACRLLYSQKATTLSDGEILQYIRQLDHELELWRLSVPVSMRPRLSISGSNTAYLNARQTKRLINLQLDYHYTLISIHTMVRKCGASNEELPEDLHSVVHSSVDLSLEAGRSMLMFLKVVLRLLGGDSFQHIQSYGPVAAMALFVNVLVHPFASSSQTDLQVLVQAVATFQAIALDTLSPLETQRIQTLNEFIMELVRLASCAIWTAKTGK